MVFSTDRGGILISIINDGRAVYNLYTVGKQAYYV